MYKAIFWTRVFLQRLFDKTDLILESAIEKAQRRSPAFNYWATDMEFQLDYKRLERHISVLKREIAESTPDVDVSLMEKQLENAIIQLDLLEQNHDRFYQYELARRGIQN